MTDDLLRFSRMVVVLLFPMLLTGCGGEQRAWENALQANTTDLYEQFVIDYPDSIRIDDARVRIRLFGDLPDWGSDEFNADIEAYREYMVGQTDEETGMLVSERMRMLEDKAWGVTESEGVAGDFGLFLEHFPGSSRLGDLSSFADDVRKTIEDAIIEEIGSGGVGNRFILSSIQVTDDSKGGRFSIKSATDGDNKRLLLSTPFEDDWFPLEVSAAGMKMNLKMTGDSLVTGLQQTHLMQDTVWRISGALELLEWATNDSQSYTITGDDDSPISFYLVHDVGAVYLHGRGGVSRSDGTELFLVQ